MTDDLPPHLRTRKELAAFALAMAETSPRVARAAQTLRWLLREHHRLPEDMQDLAVRAIERQRKHLADLTQGSPDAR